jgi:SAM-dependent methyltransferase
MLVRSLQNALSLLDVKHLALRPGNCPLCGVTLIVRLQDRDIGVRCLRCGASVIAAAVMDALKRRVPDLPARHVYELSSRGALCRYLRRHAGRLTVSEYFEDVAPGASRDGVPCQDVQALTWGPDSFDLCTSTEVFEHVADDARGFREILRVLKPGGWLIFTVPMHDRPVTRERARSMDGHIEYLEPPEYHGDQLRGEQRVLAFRDYGRDIDERLNLAGFSEVRIERFPPGGEWFGFSRPVISARKSL